jgi:hypothetical protein
MYIELIAAYEGLQLNPNNEEQTAAFEALCWKHILHRTSLHWVQQAQSGALSLVGDVRTNASSGKKVFGYDDTLDRLTFEFVKDYARFIWPSAEAKRSHLAACRYYQDKIKAVSTHTRASANVQAKLKHDLGRPCTEQMIVAESVLGRKVREFLRELVRTRAAPPVDDYSAEQALKTFLETVDEFAPVANAPHIPCPHDGCITTHAGSHALTTHLNLAHSDDTRTSIPRPASV